MCAGRYSLLGLDPDLVFRASQGRAQINRVWQHDRGAFVESALSQSENALDELRALAEACKIDVPPELPPALACLVGYFGYETIGLVETLPRAPASELALPDMLFVRPTVILIFDGLSDELYCVAPIWPDTENTQHPERAVERAGERIDETLRSLSQPRPAQPRIDAGSVSPELTPVMDGAMSISALCTGQRTTSWPGTSFRWFSHSALPVALSCLRWNCIAACGG